MKNLASPKTIRYASSDRKRPLWLAKLLAKKNIQNRKFARLDNLSGSQWVARFPDSALIADLAQPFRTQVQAFFEALLAASASVAVSSTRRPAERAYLMHWCYRIANENQDPRTVPAMAGVDIQWWHGNLPSSIQGAREMVLGYNIVFRPSLTSRHISGRAIDMTIGWTNTLSIRNANSMLTTITSTPRTHMNVDLHQVGSSYGVNKLVSDPPHWSDDGH